MIHSLYVYGTRVFYYDPFHVPWDSWDFAVVNPYFKGAKASLSLLPLMLLEHKLS